MTKDQILQLARECGAIQVTTTHPNGADRGAQFTGAELQEFTAKIREEERERIIGLIGTRKDEKGQTHMCNQGAVELIRGVK
jgi:hypothetical protein